MMIAIFERNLKERWLIKIRHPNTQYKLHDIHHPFLINIIRLGGKEHIGFCQSMLIRSVQCFLN